MVFTGMRSYHITPGLVISVCVAGLVSLRRFIRVEDLSLAGFIFTFLNFFSILFACWLIHQFILQIRFTGKLLQKTVSQAVIGLVICLLMAWVVELLFRNAHQYLSVDIQNKVFVWYIKDLILAIFQFCMVYYIKTADGSAAGKN
jgi:hypothetical protein